MQTEQQHQRLSDGGIVIDDQYGAHERMLAGAAAKHTRAVRVYTARVANAGGMDAALNAGQSTAAWPSSSTTAAPTNA